MMMNPTRLMVLAPGARIGSFSIEALLGAGGMGEVFRARDTRLDRSVALKVLPQLFTPDSDRLARFTREAHLLAALNHPNIAGIYGIEESSGIRALVLELVEGPTLAERLTAGAIPWQDALPMARQIAVALEAAHDRGIIHRDLKPANIKLTTDGTIKVLDFGLAKALNPNSSSDVVDPSNSPTETIGGTKAGVILGTAAYMAPEQARGKPVDRRADIWAFGVVLYEMLAGRRAFDGDSIQDILARVIQSDPEWRGLPADTPVAIRRLLLRCLTKDPRRRLRDIGDAVYELDDVAANPEPHVEVDTSVRWRRALPWFVATLALALGGFGLYLAVRDRPAAPVPVLKFGIVAPPHATALNPVLSPDGRFMVYSADRLYVHRFDRGDAQPLAGTEHASGQFISRDGRWIGYVDEGR